MKYYRQAQSAAIWDDIRTADTDLLLWMGDTFYQNSIIDFEIRNNWALFKHHESYGKLIDTGVPVGTMWDDHDYGSDLNTEYGAPVSQEIFDWDFNLKNMTKANFLDFFDVNKTDVRRTPNRAPYFSHTWGTTPNNRVKIIVPDLRWGRDKVLKNNQEGDGASGDTTKCDNQANDGVTRMMSEEQWTWLEQELLNTNSNENATFVTFIASTIQLLPPLDHTYDITQLCANTSTSQAAIAAMNETNATGQRFNFYEFGFEMWSKIPTERARLLRMAAKAMNNKRVGQVIFLSGDVHYAEFMEATIDGAQLIEFTASGLKQNFFGYPSAANYREAINEVALNWENNNQYRLPVYADKSGNGDFSHRCHFSYIHPTCVSSTLYPTPWCYTSESFFSTDWGYCAPSGTPFPAPSHVITDDSHLFHESNVYGKDQHTVTMADSNWGRVKFDYTNRIVSMSVKATTMEDQNTVIEPMAIKVRIPTL
jgi:phosphodiesterase/alkaline phosphatase D-like protein